MAALKIWPVDQIVNSSLRSSTSVPAPNPPDEVDVGLAMIRIVILIGVGLYILIGRVINRRKLPPGPTPWPVIGNLPALSGGLPHRTLKKLSDKYGGLMFLRLGSTSCVVVSTSVMVEKIWKEQDANFSSRPEGLILDPMSFGYRTVSMAPHGDFWRELRRICKTELGDSHIASYEERREREIRIMLEGLEVAARAGEVVDLATILYSLSSNDMTSMLLNQRFFAEVVDNKKQAEEFKEVLAARMQLSGRFVIGDFVPWLRFIDYLRGYHRRAQEIQEMTNSTCRRIMCLEQRRKRVADQLGRSGAAELELHGNDFVDELVSRQYSQAWARTSVDLSDDRIITLLVQDMLVAGTDTSALTIEWAMAELIRNPQIMRDAQEEVAEVVGTNNTTLVTESDVAQMPLLEAIVKETFRLHPPVPLNLPRESTKACEIGSFSLPAKTRLIICQWAIHRDPEKYPDPDSFRPERFLQAPQDSITTNGHDSFELLPFGMGRRACPGMKLGILIVKAALANLIHRFDWELPDGQDPANLDMTESFGLTAPRESPLLVIPRLRNQPVDA